MNDADISNNDDANPIGCLASYNDIDGNDDHNTSAAMACLASTLTQLQQQSVSASQREDDLAISLDVFFLIFSATLMFIMQAGFAMVCAGCVRQKNVQNTMTKNVLDCCGAALGFFLIGFGIAYGGTDPTSNGTSSTFAGNDNFLLLNDPDLAFFFYQFSFAAATTTIVAGCLAERVQMVGYFLYSLVVAAIVFPLIAHAIWSTDGYLNAFKANRFLDVGVVDFAGAGVVHITGGTLSLVASVILGPRRGRFYDAGGNILETPVPVQGYSVPLQTLGTFLLWVGWFGFNGGSVRFISTPDAAQVASLAVVNTVLGGSAGCITALFADGFQTYYQIRELQLKITVALNGALTGLVGVTGCCAIVEPWAAVLIGALSGLVYISSSALLLRLRIDDAIDAIPVHLFGGIWGMIATALFASPSRFSLVYPQDEHVGLFYALARGSSAKMLAANLVGTIFIVGFASAIMTPFFLIINQLGWFRADAIEELVGLDCNFAGAVDANGNQISTDEIRDLGRA